MLCVIPSAMAQEIRQAPDSAKAELRIIGSLQVTPFVPPTPKVRKQFPLNEVRAITRSRMENGKRLHVTRAAPSSLPDLAIIRAEIAHKEEAAAARRSVATDFSTAKENHRFLSLGATIIDHRISHVTWMDASGEMMEALCGFDIGLLANVPAIKNGETGYSINMMPGYHVSRRDGSFEMPAFPHLRVEPGEIRLPVGATEEKSEMLSDLRLLGDLIMREKGRLEAYRKAVEAKQEAERKWREQNPEPPRDETVWIRPHSGSRYLQEIKTPTKAKGARQ